MLSLKFFSFRSLFVVTHFSLFMALVEFSWRHQSSIMPVKNSHSSNSHSLDWSNAEKMNVHFGPAHPLSPTPPHTHTHTHTRTHTHTHAHTHTQHNTTQYNATQHTRARDKTLKSDSNPLPILMQSRSSQWWPPPGISVPATATETTGPCRTMMLFARVSVEGNNYHNRDYR